MTDTSIVLTPVPLETLEQRFAEVVRREIAAHAAKEPEPPSDELLTRKEAAQLLSVSLPTLHEYTQRGLLPAYRLGSRVRYKKTELIAALQQMRAARQPRS